MAHVQFISDLLGRHLLMKQIIYEDLGEIDGIILLKKQSTLPKGYLCIATETVLKEQLPLLALKHPTTILVAESQEKSDYTYIKNHPQLNILVTDCDLIDLYNKINTLVCNYKFWSMSLMKALCDSRNLQQVICLAGDMIKAPVILFNAGYNVICGTANPYFDDVYINEVLKKGHLSYEHASVFSQKPSSISTEHYELAEHRESDTGHRYFNCEIMVHGHAVANLLTVASPSHRQIDIADLTIKLADVVRRFLLKDSEDPFDSHTTLSVFVSDLIENRLTDMVEIQNRLKALRYPIDGFVSFIIVRFDMDLNSGKIPYSYIVSQLEEIFPEINITVYKHDICIIYCQKERSYGSLDFDYTKFQIILERYHAYAGISNGTRHLNYLRTMYLIAGDIIKLGVPLKHQVTKQAERIFHYEDYSTYYIIDLSVQRYIQLHGHDDIIYLTHPSIIALYRYDNQHNSDLLNVLFYYLIHGNNISKTAKALYMHRNTVQNKISRITSIINLPLDDGFMQQRMIFSCLLMRYYENYMNNQVKL